MLDRRRFLAGLGGVTVAGAWSLPVRAGSHGGAGRAAGPMLTRPIPATGEALPVIGMGTSRTFDVGPDPALRAPLADVVRTLFDGGGTLIDSSPMYGKAEAVTGELLQAQPAARARLFAATKVWTDGQEEGIRQMEESFRLMGVTKMDLMQVHNLRDWRTHLQTLRAWQEQGRIRYLGITTSNVRQYDDFAAVMRAEPWDFVQLNYSLGEREAEDVLLPLARDRGMATLINRPYMRGELFGRVRGRALPPWAAEFDCTSWGQYFMKFIVSHPAVTCVIPATTSAKNMADNVAGGTGRLPDAATRQRMIEYLA